MKLHNFLLILFVFLSIVSCDKDERYLSNLSSPNDSKPISTNYEANNSRYVDTAQLKDILNRDSTQHNLSNNNIKFIFLWD